jgi:hopene-associated glycosyltransferase HpnB
MLLFSHWLLWLASLSLAGWLYLIFGRGAFWHAESLPDPAVSSERRLPDVVAVMPARNEAAYVARSLRSLLAQDYPGRFGVVLVDDNSEDHTRTIAEAIPTRPGRLLEVIGARPLPAGWSGKLWAVSEGLRRGFERMPDAPYVLLTDADVQHDPGNLRRLVAKAEADRLDLVSLMVRLHCQHLWERLLIPPFVFFFRERFPFAAVNRQHRTEAAANGGCILVRRQALRRIGGIEAIHDRVIDDIALAQRIKHYPPPGTGRIWLGLTGSTSSLRDLTHSGRRSSGSCWNCEPRTSPTGFAPPALASVSGCYASPNAWARIRSRFPAGVAAADPRTKPGLRGVPLSPSSTAQPSRDLFGSPSISGPKRASRSRTRSISSSSLRWTKRRSPGFSEDS